MISPYVYPDLASQERFRILKGRLRYDFGLLRFVEELVTSYFGETVEGMKLRSRKRNKVLCRHVCFYLIRNNTSLTYREIGERFDRQDHTSVMHGLQSIQNLIDTDEKTRSDIRILEEKIEQRN